MYSTSPERIPFGSLRSSTSSSVWESTSSQSSVAAGRGVDGNDVTGAATTRGRYQPASAVRREAPIAGCVQGQCGLYSTSGVAEASFVSTAGFAHRGRGEEEEGEIGSGEVEKDDEEPTEPTSAVPSCGVSVARGGAGGGVDGPRRSSDSRESPCCAYCSHFEYT